LSGLRRRNKQTLLFEGANSLGAELQLDFLAVYHHRFVLEVWFPDLLGVALAEANVATVLLALASEFTFLHDYFLKFLKIQGVIVEVLSC
jgi:hypothetical protein